MRKQWKRDTQVPVIGVFYTFYSLFFPNNDRGDFFSLLIFIISIPFSSPCFNEKNKKYSYAPSIPGTRGCYARNLMESRRHLPLGLKCVNATVSNNSNLHFLKYRVVSFCVCVLIIRITESQKCLYSITI